MRSKTGTIKHFGRLLIILLTLLPWTGTAQDTALVRVFGGQGIEKGVDLAETPDGGLLLLGNSGEYGKGSSDILLIKTDSNGSLQWSKTIGGNDLEVGTAIEARSDSSFLIAGFTDRKSGKGFDGMLLKVDEAGNVLKDSTYGSIRWDFFNDLAIGADGGALLVGNSYANEDSDLWALKIDSLGKKEWSRTFRDTGYEEAHSVIRSSDSSFAVVGETDSRGPGTKAMFQLEVHRNGDSLWMRTYGDTAEEIAYAIARSSGDDRLLTGSTTSKSDGDRDVWTLKTDDSGAKEWVRLDGGSEFVGDPVSKDDVGKDLMETPDSNIIMGGSTRSYGAGGKDFYTVRRDFLGNNPVGPTFGGGEDDGFEAVLRMNSGRKAFLGSTESFGKGQKNVCLILLDSMLTNYVHDTAIFTAEPVNTELEERGDPKGPEFQVHPNPARERVSVSVPKRASKKMEGLRIRMIGVRGQEKLDRELRKNPFELKLDGLRSGYYHLILYSPNEAWQRSRPLILK